VFKRYVSIFLAVMMIFTFVGCDSSDNGKDTTKNTSKTSQTQPDTEAVNTTSTTEPDSTSTTVDTTLTTTTDNATTTTVTTTKKPVTTTKKSVTTNKKPVVDTPSANKFITVKGTKLYQPDGSEYLIRGIAFGNEVWGNPKVEPRNHHDENSYKELAELGFNSVRFYLNYGLFESDSNPYVYKQAGFDWIDKNIEWAKKYGIKLVLNMHYPQGGYQSQGNGMALWTSTENQNRLIALWKEIAKRYADEECILGYGFINEPYVPTLETTEKTVNQVKSLMQRITDAVRTVDKNHLVFIERMMASKDSSGNSHWTAGEFLIDDDKAVYEFHSYSPHSFTHQDMDWAGTEGKVTVYPSYDEMTADYKNYWVGCKASEFKYSEGDWHYFESAKVTRGQNYNVGSVTFLAGSIGTGKTVYIDDVVITEYDKNGKVLNTYKYGMDADDCSVMYFWSEDGKGSSGFEANMGRTEKGCLYITDTTSDANATGLRYELKEGRYYTISGWVNYGDCTNTSNVKPRIDYALAENIMYLDKAYLEHILLQDLDYYIEKNVPAYIGEFGTCLNSFKDSRGGAQWVTDMLELLEKYDVNYNYHTYHESAFGLHATSGKISSTSRNEVLADIFKKYQK